jgi:RNA polymerase-interacting CarD/CdnL/TRCF family regulator
MDRVIELKYRAGEPICLFFIDMDNEDTHYYRVPMRCIDEMNMKRLDEWHHVLDVSSVHSLKIPDRIADENEEDFEKRLMRRETRINTNKLVEDVIRIANLGQEIYPEDFVGGINTIRKVVKVSVIAHS